MFRYCLDTSGFSNPALDLPEDIHVTLWTKIVALVETHALCWNREIGDELKSITGAIGQCLRDCDSDCCLEIGAGNWPWEDYLAHVERMRVEYRQYISEYNGNRKNTIGLNDLSIVALAKTLGLPVLSMEKPNRGQVSERKMRIPDLCVAEGVMHYDFNGFLRAEGITS